MHGILCAGTAASGGPSARAQTNFQEPSVKHKSIPKRMKWPVVWLLQFAAMLLASALTALSLWLGGTIHGLMSWLFMPAAGFVSALIVTRSGLLNYAAWIAPPVMMFLGHWIFWAYSPKVGPVFLCAFISLVGAAAGEVLKQQTKENMHGKRSDSHM